LAPPGTRLRRATTVTVSPRPLVLGVGNTLLGDEGIGVHAVHCLRAEHLPADVDLLDGGTLSFTLAGRIAGVQQLIVIDAGNLAAEPGTVACFEAEAMDAFLGRSRGRSVHEVSLLDLLAIACLSGELPERRALIVVEPCSVAWSDRLSPALARTLPFISQTVRQLIDGWRQ
jgi:hydrogenase maturation protease